MDIEAKKSDAMSWFRSLRDQICAEFEAIEVSATGNAAVGRFERKQWQRPTDDGSEGGGGEISAMRGRVFEKVGVNISTVSGVFSERDDRFIALKHRMHCGINHLNNIHLYH